MSKSSSLLLFGGLVFITSFLGIPSSWKTIVFGVLGALIVMIALFLRKDIATGALCMHLAEEKQTDSYKQNGMLPRVTKKNTQESITESDTEDNQSLNEKREKESEQDNSVTESQA